MFEPKNLKIQFHLDLKTVLIQNSIFSSLKNTIVNNEKIDKLQIKTIKNGILQYL